MFDFVGGFWLTLVSETNVSPSGEDHLARPRKRAEAALADSEARFRALVRASSSLVWTSAADGQIVDMPEWRALTGQTVDEIRGWGWLNSLHPDDRARTEVVWQAAVGTRSYYETEYRIRHRDGMCGISRGAFPCSRRTAASESGSVALFT